MSQEQKQKYRETMILKFGSYEKWQEFMRAMGAKGGTKSSNGGFAYMKEKDPERLKEISSKAGKLRHGKKITKTEG